MKVNLKIIGVILLGVLALLLGFSINRNYKLKNEISISEQNIKALSDSVRIEKNKVGQLEYVKGVLISDKDKLSSLSIKLAEELANAKGKVSEITNYDVVIKKGDVKPSISKRDTIFNTSEGDFVVNWNFDTIYNKNNWRKLNGETYFSVKSGEIVSVTPKYSKILEDSDKINITQGLRKKGDLIEVFVTSDHPYFSVENIESVIIDPKDHVINDIVKPKVKRFGIGPVIGYGLTENGLNYFIGAGVSYNIIRF